MSTSLFFFFLNIFLNEPLKCIVDLCFWWLLECSWTELANFWVCNFWQSSAGLTPSYHIQELQKERWLVPQSPFIFFRMQHITFQESNFYEFFFLRVFACEEFLNHIVTCLPETATDSAPKRTAAMFPEEFHCVKANLRWPAVQLLEQKIMNVCWLCWDARNKTPTIKTTCCFICWDEEKVYSFGCWNKKKSPKSSQGTTPSAGPWIPGGRFSEFWFRRWQDVGFVGDLRLRRFFKVSHFGMICMIFRCFFGQIQAFSRRFASSHTATIMGIALPCGEWTIEFSSQEGGGTKQPRVDRILSYQSGKTNSNHSPAFRENGWSTWTRSKWIFERYWVEIYWDILIIIQPIDLRVVPQSIVTWA